MENRKPISLRANQKPENCEKLLYIYIYIYIYNDDVRETWFVAEEGNTPKYFNDVFSIEYTMYIIYIYIYIYIYRCIYI